MRVARDRGRAVVRDDIAAGLFSRRSRARQDASNIRGGWSAHRVAAGPARPRRRGRARRAVRTRAAGEKSRHPATRAFRVDAEGGCRVSLRRCRPAARALIADAGDAGRVPAGCPRGSPPAASAGSARQGTRRPSRLRIAVVERRGAGLSRPAATISRLPLRPMRPIRSPSWMASEPVEQGQARIGLTSGDGANVMRRPGHRNTPGFHALSTH